jgi:hypothetical protein
MGSAYGDYRFLSRAELTGSFRGEFRYHGSNLRQFNSLASITYPSGMPGLVPDPTQVQHAYHVVNAMFIFGSGVTQYRLYLDNLTNQAPYLDFNRVLGASYATTLQPRTLGVSVKTSF